MTSEDKEEKEGLSRRAFLRFAGSAAVGYGALALYSFPGRPAVAGAPVLPPSTGYLLADPKKCAGCLSCMLACSVAHEGKESLSLSRIQIVQYPLGKFPADIAVAQCRQCLEPSCVEACPTGALAADPAKGNVRTVDEEKCTGCRKCLDACAFAPGRLVWDLEAQRARKCDLCAGARFLGAAGGPGGRQACADVCPMRAIRFTAAVPAQAGDLGYYVNLRNENWKKLGFPVE
ncbi:MAG: 4Fe-4S dicluster domain-containing protein [Deltaproteobacteria bacterium]|nr:4Fe-4S dicluster domain-containing protein [Deltaproteobacteria bacterium]